jgi:hypothetical protein
MEITDSELVIFQWGSYLSSAVGKAGRMDCLIVGDDFCSALDVLDEGLQEGLDSDRYPFKYDDLAEMPGITDKEFRKAVAQSASIEGFVAAFRAVGAMIGVDPDRLQTICSYWHESSENLPRRLEIGELEMLIQATLIDENIDAGETPIALTNKLQQLNIIK